MGKKYRDLVRKHSKATGSARAVLNILADYANEEGLAWPGHNVIAADTGLSTRTVSRSIDELCNGGELTVEEGGLGRGNHYVWRITISTKGDKKGDTKGDKKVTDSQVKSKEANEEKATNLHGKGDNLSSRIYKDLEPNIEPYISSADADGAQPELLPTLRLVEEGKPSKVIEPTEHQQMFGKICDIVGWDYQTLSSDSKGKVAQTLGILREAGYSLADLNRFGVEVWAKDWRWREKKQRPTLGQLREEIGKLRQTAFVGEMVKATVDTYDSPRKRMKVLA